MKNNQARTSFYGAFFSLIAFLLTIAVNALANILPINGKSTGSLSDAYPSLFTPAGFTFSVWGLIYLLLFFFVVYTFYAASKRLTIPKGIVSLFVLSCVLNASWIFAWHYEMLLVSVLVMLLLLSSVIAIFIKTTSLKNANWIEQLCLKIPFAVYLGWLSVATVANITVFFVSRNLSSDMLFTPEHWTMIMISIAAIIAMILVYSKRSFAYGFVTVWAIAGIVAKHCSNVPLESNIINTSYVASGAILLFVGLRLLKLKSAKN
jgi:hypothetical protein